MKKSDIRKLNRILTFIQVSNNPEWYTTVKNLIESFGGEFFNSGENNYLYGIVLNNHNWVSISSESYIIYETIEKIDSCQWYETTIIPQCKNMTEYYL